MYREHITVEGERWDQIAARYLGDPHRYPELIALNGHAPIAATLPGGIALSIPVETAPARLPADALPPWKR